MSLTQAERRSAYPQPPSETGENAQGQTVPAIADDDARLVRTADLKEFLRLEHDEDNDLLAVLISSAYAQVERFTSRLARPRARYATWRKESCNLPPAVWLPDGVHGFTPAPAGSSTLPDSGVFSIEMFTDEMASVKLTETAVSFAPGLSGLGIRLFPTDDWPDGTDHYGVFMIVRHIPHTLIYEDEATVSTVSQAVLMLAAGGYEHRESETMMQRVRPNPTIERMLLPLRRIDLYRLAI